MKIPDKFNFNNDDVVEGFDKHVRNQLPWYDLATEAIENIVLNYFPEGGRLYDIGASTGNIANKVGYIVDDRHGEYTPIEPSEKMIKKAITRYKFISSKAEDFKYKKYDVCILFLVLMFIPVSKRDKLIKKLKKKLKKGGCIIIVDKTTPDNGYQSVVDIRLTLKEKMKTETSDDILKKELSLSGVQRPIDSKSMSKYANFFRFGNFSGWVITKD